LKNNTNHFSRDEFTDGTALKACLVTSCVRETSEGKLPDTWLMMMYCEECAGVNWRFEFNERGDNEILSSNKRNYGMQQQNYLE
jgi:hypothetical protein